MKLGEMINLSEINEKLEKLGLRIEVDKDGHSRVYEIKKEDAKRD